MKIAKQFPTDADVVTKSDYTHYNCIFENKNLEQSIWVLLSEMRLNR